MMPAGTAGRMPVTMTPEALEAARARLLGELERRHAAAPTAETSFDLARVRYQQGRYEDALRLFRIARDLAPGEPATHLSLVRAASATGERTLEREALAAAIARFPRDPALQLHAALAEVPGDLAAARARLGRFSFDPACAEFGRAVEHLLAGTTPPAVAGGDPRAAARVESLRWARARGAGPAAFAGLPADVLERALDAAPAEGLTLECGVYFGRSIRRIAARTPGPVHGFDSFQGLPEAWSAVEGAGAYSTGGRLPVVPANVSLHAGWFEDTLAPFLATHPGPVRLLHVDCDLYSSTRTVLDAVEARLVPGSVVLFDDMLGYPGFEAHELRAFEEFEARSGLHFELVCAALLGREVAMRVVAGPG